MLFALAALTWAQELRVSAGAVDRQVFQRGPGNTATIELGGTADRLSGDIEARLTSAGKAVRGFSWARIATAAGATWTGAVKDVPAGGPYTLEIRARGAMPVLVRDLLVGDLWVLAGQSNMEGYGDLTDFQQPDPRVHSYTMTEEWSVASEPLHELSASIDPVHWPKPQTGPLKGSELASYREARRKGAGLGLPFAVEMVRRTGVPVGLVPCAHGGTSMSQWNPELRDKAGASLYGSMYRRVQAVGGKVAGVLWYQGESDANPKAVDAFRSKFENLIRAVRADFGSPGLPFYYVQLGRHVNNGNQAEWNKVQEIQRQIEGALEKTGAVPAVDLALDDGIHIGTQGLKLLGGRFANLVSPLKGMKKGPRVRSASWQAGTGAFATIRVVFDEVNGQLQSAGRPSGFSIQAPDGSVVPMIYRVDLKGGEAHLQVQGKLPPGATLAYGAGKDPYCNVTDAASMGMLAFSGLAIAQ